MSLVPLFFRDWWDDLDAPLRSSRLRDQQFGSGLRRDDLVSSFWNPASMSSRSGYLRPWHNMDLLDQESRVNFDKNQFQVILDVQQFLPKEINVKTADRHIVVEGKHEEKQDEHGFIERHFVRRYRLPNSVNPIDISSSLSSDGVLTVTAPIKQQIRHSPERVIPIEHTGKPNGEIKN